MWWCWCTAYIQVGGGGGVQWINYTYRLDAHVVVLVYCGSTTPTGWMPMWWCCTVDQLHLQVGCPCGGVGVLWINYPYRLDAHVVVLVYCGSTTPTGWMPMWWCWYTVDQLHLQVGCPCGGVGVLWSKNISHACKIFDPNDVRLLGIDVDTKDGKSFLLNAYLR